MSGYINIKILVAQKYHLEIKDDPLKWRKVFISNLDDNGLTRAI